MRILKFGGTSVADAAAMARVTSIVRDRPGARTVVVSALAGATDALLAIADLAGRDGDGAIAALETLTARHHAVAATLRSAYARRVLEPALDGITRGAAATVRAIETTGASAALVDRLLACGELWSSRLVSGVFEEAGLAIQWIDARHVLRTDGGHGRAVPDLTMTDKAVARLVRPALALDRIVVLGGFIGSGPDGATTTLGRGGSDYSAAVLGACLLADEIEIWTDVDGVLTADPRVVPGARVMPSLSYEDAETLATFGAKVLHPKTMEPAASRDIPVRVLNSHRPAAPGTRIDASTARATGYTAVASRPGLCLVEFTSRGRPVPTGFAARVLQALDEAQVALVISEVHRDRVCAAVDGAVDVTALAERVEAFADVRSRNGLSVVCAVGHHLAKPLVMVVDERHAHAIVARLHDSFTETQPLEAREGVAS